MSNAAADRKAKRGGRQRDRSHLHVSASDEANEETEKDDQCAPLGEPEDVPDPGRNTASVQAADKKGKRRRLQRMQA